MKCSIEIAINKYRKNMKKSSLECHNMISWIKKYEWLIEKSVKIVGGTLLNN